MARGHICVGPLVSKFKTTVYGNGAMNFIINRKCCLLRTYEFHYVLPKRYNQLVSAKSADVNSNWDKYIT